jgi:hypothetical protein
MPPAAIGVVRVSGPGSGEALRSLAGHLPAPRRASLAELKDADGAPLDRARHMPASHAERLFPLALGLGGEQVGKPLGFGQIDPPVEKRPPREFARLSPAQSRDG